MGHIGKGLKSPDTLEIITFLDAVSCKTVTNLTGPKRISMRYWQIHQSFAIGNCIENGDQCSPSSSRRIFTSCTHCDNKQDATVNNLIRECTSDQKALPSNDRAVNTDLWNTARRQRSFRKKQAISI